MRLTLEKFGVYLVDLPEQGITKKGENGRPFTVVGTEMHGIHQCLVVAVDSDSQFAVVIPLSSALNANGGEKWQVWRKSWARVQNEGQYAAVMCEQIRYADRGRFIKFRGFMGEFDQRQVTAKLKSLMDF